MRSWILLVYVFTMATVGLQAPNLSAKEILDSAWTGEPKTYLNGRLMCSPDPEDNPVRRPAQPVKGYPSLKPYLYIKRVGQHGFQIFEGDNCGAVFGFDGRPMRSIPSNYPEFLTEGYYFFYENGDVFSRQGQKVGTIARDRIEITAGGARDTEIKYLLMEIQADGRLSFYADFRIHGISNIEHPRGSRHEHVAIYTSMDKK